MNNKRGMDMKKIIKPVVKKIEANTQELIHIQEELKSEILSDFPVVYIHSWKNDNAYEIYVGETNNIVQRTKEHLKKSTDPDQWQYQLKQKKSSLYIIGHKHFNKSLTLDIENRLMLYMMSAENVKKIHNLRGNAQRRYYTDCEMDLIFQMIWEELQKDNRELFPKECAIKDSAVFKASPLHKLTEEQETIKNSIVEKVFDSLKTKEKGQLIFIEGEAGTGKTVLNSSAFYEILSSVQEEKKMIKCSLIVNHDEQITVYKQIAQKLGLLERYGVDICKPTPFINRYTEENSVDVAFIDEAHLLLTQGKQSYTGKNQLEDIIKRARVTVVMFDENQILTAEQYWEAKRLKHYKELSKQQNNYFELKNQLRIKAPKEVINWIDDFTKNKRISKIPENQGEYEIKIFNSPYELESELKKKAKKKEYKLSRLIATYDWKYNAKTQSEKRASKYWEVAIGEWHKPWNRELNQKLDKKIKIQNKVLSWAEQSHTIEEVGSTFTIQGFDLSYAGVILGPSVKYENGKIKFDITKSCNKKAIQNRTLSDGTKQKFGEILIQHEVRVLMTRGVKGLYIYACDPVLKEALLDAAK